MTRASRMLCRTSFVALVAPFVFIAPIAIVALRVSSPRLLAQPTQPIYVQYDGFVRNKDGTLTLSFGYFNTNNVSVSIAPGDANGFTPAPADRNQPVVFLKGRHRFACSMVVDKTFDGKLQWTVKFADKTNTSTAKLLDPLYELELNSEKHAVQGLDVATAPKNVCVNRPPHVQVATAPFEAPRSEGIELQARAGQELPIAGVVEDDGLPRGGTLTYRWKKVSGPGDVTFSDASAASTRATFAAPGSYELELSSSDGEKTGTLKLTVKVS